MSESMLITDPDVFADSYQPSNLVDRSDAFARLRRAVAPVAARRGASHVCLHGPPGSGKTATALALLGEFEDRHGMGAYINCWEFGTLYAILDKLVRDYRLLRAERLSSFFKLERLERHLRGRPFLLVLDEFDKPTAGERDTIFYNLASIPRCGLVLICNSRASYLELDERVRSRLHPLFVRLEPYPDAQIADILQRRAERGLESGSIDDATLHEIAQRARGDARVAIQSLRLAAARAEHAGSKQIQRRHLADLADLSVETRRRYRLAKLTAHHRLIYALIREAGTIASGPLQDGYRERCRRITRQPVADRTFSLYLKQLTDAQLVAFDRALGVRGNVRLFRTGTDTAA